MAAQNCAVRLSRCRRLNFQPATCLHNFVLTELTPTKLWRLNRWMQNCTGLSGRKSEPAKLPGSTNSILRGLNFSTMRRVFLQRIANNLPVRPVSRIATMPIVHAERRENKHRRPHASTGKRAPPWRNMAKYPQGARSRWAGRYPRRASDFRRKCSEYTRLALVLLQTPAAIMSFCILRTEKLTTFGSIVGSAKHTFREIPTPNADATRTHLNKTFGAQNAAAVRAAIEARLPEKRRKDAVLCIEYLITASPEWFHTARSAQQNAYFKSAAAWLEERHGKDNVVCVNMQLDETSPHLVAYVVPLTKDGRLAAKDFLGGREALSKMQTDFANRVGIPAGLQRGVEGSKATHTSNKAYNAALQKNPTLVRPTPPPAPTIADRFNGKAEQITAAHQAAEAEHAALVEQARNVALVSRHARASQAAALEKMRQELQQAKLHELEAARLREENKRLEAEREEKEQEFAIERQSFVQAVNELKMQLEEAVKKIIRMTARILFLEDRLFPKRQNRLAVVDDDGDSSLKFRP